MSGQSALEANANAAEQNPPTHADNASTSSAGDSPRRFLNVQQSLLVKEFTDSYDISPEQIGFDGESATPFFHYEALAQIVFALTDYAETSVRQVDINHSHGHVTCEATITLRDERTVRSFGSCFISEELPGGQTVENFQTALDVARARALRSTLRLVGFDPVRAHEASKRQAKPDEPRITPEEEARNKALAEIHVLADEAGLIASDDDSKYRKVIGTFFEGLTSSRDMDARQRAQFIAILRGLKSARAKAEGDDGDAK